MKPALKYSLITIGVLVLCAPILYLAAFTVVMPEHAKEDRIVFGGKRVEEAINNYMEKHGVPPAKIESLIPEFMEAIPSMPEKSSGLSSLRTRKGMDVGSSIGQTTKVHGFFVAQACLSMLRTCSAESIPYLVARS